MSVFVNAETRIVVQGITGREGRFHALACREYGSRVVAGVTPGKGGREVEGIPVFDTVRQAVERTGADCSLVFVPPAFAAEAIMEAADAGIALVIAVTEGIPVLDMLEVKHFADLRGCRLIGPNCPGVITPGQCKAGIMPGSIHLPGGPVGVVSRSGTLTYEVVYQLTAHGLGQTTCVGIGGDPVNGTDFIDCLAAFASDGETRAVVMVGEIGGNAEEEAAAFIKENIDMPVVGFIAGLTAPPGKRMGHAGAIISGGGGTAAAKIEAMRAAGIVVCENLWELGGVCARTFARVRA